MRAVAILAVLAYHLGHMPSGFFGVDVFFVISGYLITGLLADEQRRNGAVSLTRFYGRRALRLLPALFVVLAGCLIVGTIVLSGEQVRNLWWSTLYVATYTADIRAVDYAAMPLLAHTWSLAVEEQFYIFWPLLFSRMTGRLAPHRLAAWLLGVSVAVTLWCGIEFEQGASVARLSDLPDTHAMGLVLGSAIAVVLGIAGTGLPAGLHRALRVAAYLSAAALLISFRAVIGHGAFPYLGGFFVVSALTGLIIVDQVSAAPSRLAVVLQHPVAVLIGRWSYSLYLVHLPVIELLRRTKMSSTQQIALAIPLSFLLAALLHLAVERTALRLRHRIDGADRHGVSAPRPA